VFIYFLQNIRKWKRRRKLLQSADQLNTILYNKSLISKLHHVRISQSECQVSQVDVGTSRIRKRVQIGQDRDLKPAMGQSRRANLRCQSRKVCPSIVKEAQKTVCNRDGEEKQSECTRVLTYQTSKEVDRYKRTDNMSQGSLQRIFADPS